MRFLERVVHNIFQDHPSSSWYNLILVLPTKRAVTTLRREFSKKIQSPVISPEILTIDDFITSWSGLIVPSRIELLLRLYTYFEKEISLSEFLPWGKILLSDFDALDLHFVEDPRSLFLFHSEMESLKRWNLDEIEENSSSKAFLEKFKLWEEVYFQYSRDLKRDGLAYRGLAYRSFAEEVELFANELAEEKQLYFIGLNALSKSEETIIKHFLKYRTAVCLWDSDSYYMQGDHPAGRALRTYYEDSAYGKWNFLENFFLQNKKKIEVNECSFDVLQPKVAIEYIKTEKGVKDCAVIIPNEELLQIFLENLPSDFASISIQMSLSMKNSKLLILWLKVLGLISQGKNAILRKDIENILFDPAFQWKKNEFQETLENFKKERFFRISKSSLQKIISKEVVHLFFEPVFSLKEVVDRFEMFLNFFNREALETLEKEFHYHLFEICQVIKNMKLDIGVDGFCILLKELLQNEKLTLEGDRNSTIQIMGLLESRCLDFDHVLVLGLNENSIPQSKKNKSLFAYEVQRNFGLPTYSNQEDVMAYHFYRLLSKAPNIKLIYSTSAHGLLGSKSEPSRYIQDLKQNLLPKGKVVWTQKETGLEIKGGLNGEIQIRKSPQILKRINEILDKGLSPTALNELLSCSLKFYYKRVLHFSESEEIEERIDAAEFGTWIHAVIERITKPRIGKPIGIEEKHAMKMEVRPSIENVINEYFDYYEIDQGINLLDKLLAIELLENYFESIEESTVFLETEMESMQVPLETKNGNSWKLYGKIDLVKKKNGKTILVDFKTGKVELSMLEKEDYSLNIQLIIYLFLYSKEKKVDVSQLNAELVVLNNLKNKYQLKPISQNKLEERISSLSNLVDELLDSDTAIGQTTDYRNCQYCSYKNLCLRS